MRADELALIFNPATLSPAVAVGDTLIDSMEALVAAHPELGDGAGEAALVLALAFNHFARGDQYEVIFDPAAFESAYRSAVAAEEPEAPWSQTVVRLRDFGMPDYSRIHEPYLAGSDLGFFARDAMTGLAYEVSGPLKAPQAAAYEPLALSRVDA